MKHGGNEWTAGADPGGVYGIALFCGILGLFPAMGIIKSCHHNNKEKEKNKLELIIEQKADSLYRQHIIKDSLNKTYYFNDSLVYKEKEI
ncbi:MAG: hypothetical protein ACP5N2_02185 [Candidatus Nanoarchaeia archaeon]